MREVFEELGLENETLEKAVEHVGASDDTLMAFMKVSALFLLPALHFPSLSFMPGI